MWNCCQQIKYILKTYINLWTENYGRQDSKQLVNAIINDEPEKTRRIAELLGVNTAGLSCAYFFFNRDPGVTAELLYVHKNTVKYRLKQLEKILGYSLNAMPEAYSLYLAAALARLKRVLSRAAFSQKRRACGMVLCSGFPYVQINMQQKISNSTCGVLFEKTKNPASFCPLFVLRKLPPMI